MTAQFQWDRSRTLIMGVLNITPDSFSDGGQFLDIGHAVARGIEMAEEGADIIDVGGESSRPGAQPLDAHEESLRVVPVVRGLSSVLDIPISVDTCKALVAKEALDAGASIINDISSFEFDPAMPAIASASGAGVILMHMQGTPQTMQNEPSYDDVVAEVREYLDRRVKFAVEAGIAKERIAIDPGIGFGKNLEHNLQLLARLDELRQLGQPLVIGVSRKSFIGKVLNKPVTERRWGTAACVAWAVAHGANVVRVHDVAEMRQVARMVEAIAGAGKL